MIITMTNFYRVDFITRQRHTEGVDPVDCFALLVWSNQQSRCYVGLLGNPSSDSATHVNLECLCLDTLSTIEYCICPTSQHDQHLNPGNLGPMETDWTGRSRLGRSWRPGTQLSDSQSQRRTGEYSGNRPRQVPPGAA